MEGRKEKVAWDETIEEGGQVGRMWRMQRSDNKGRSKDIKSRKSDGVIKLKLKHNKELIKHRRSMDLGTHY